MIDRQKRQGSAGDLFAHRNKRQDGVAQPVAHHFLGQCHTVDLLHPTERNAAAKRRVVDEPPYPVPRMRQDQLQLAKLADPDGTGALQSQRPYS